MVSVADDEIVLGGDTSGLVRALAQARAAFDDATRAGGLNETQIKKVSASYERASATIAASAMKNASANQANASASKQATASMDQQAAAARKLAAEEKRVFEAMGLARNSNNRVITTKGTWADAETIATAKSYIRTLDEITRAEELLTRQQAARAAAASRANATQPTGVMSPNATGPIGSAAWVSSQNTKGLAEFQKVQAAVVGQIPQMMTLRGLLNQIPPVTWAQNLGKAGDALLGMSNSARYALYSVSAGAAIAGAAIGGIGVIAINAAVSHERAFANVQRTTQSTAAGYEVLRKNLQGLAMEIPITYEEITKVATAAGQLGIQASGITNFTKTVAMLSATTNLTSDAAATALARFKAFFAEASDPSLAVTERTFSNLASSILKVGVNSIATESGIVNVATQISSMGKLAGFTANQVIGLSGALSSVGVAPELSRGITTRLFTIIGDAVSEGGVQLEKFAGIAGVSASEFKKAWGTEAFAGVFTGFLQGLNGIQKDGGDANQALRDIGITAVRDRPVWLRLASAANELGVSGGLVAQTMEDAEQGWRQNAELALQYTKISQTASARIQVMTQAFEQLFASMGAESGNFVGEMAKNMTGLLRVFDEFAQSDVGKVLGTIVVQGALVVGAILLVVGALAGLGATAQAVGQGFREMTAAGVGGASRLAGAFRLVSAASGIIGLIATLATTVGMFVAMSAAAEKAASPVQDLAGLVNAMQLDAENGSKGIKFFAQEVGGSAEDAARAAAQTEGLSNALDGVPGSAEPAGSAIDKVAQKTKKASYIFGDAATEFFKSSLIMDEGFQKIFDPTNNANQLASKFKISLPDLDWDSMIRASVQGQDVGTVAMQEIRKALRAAHPEMSAEDIDFASRMFSDFSGQVEEQLGKTKGPIQGQINATQALASATTHSVAEMVDDYELLDDVSKKAVDNMTAGFQAFASSSALIGLTQKMNEIFGQTDVDAETMAAQWEEAWSDAFGGASFSIESYMEVFRRAAGEQRTFVENLQSLSARGLSTSIIEELSAMGPEANKLVGALVAGTDAQLQEYEDLWGTTGYDSMIKLATQTAIGAEIVKNVLAQGGIEALRAFNDQLASGVGVDEALAAIQLDVNGNPIKPKLEQPDTGNFLWSLHQNLGTVYVPVTPYLTKTQIYAGALSSNGSSQINLAATGGYITGPGTGTSDSIPARLSNGEFVMTAAATRAIGVDNLYSLMRQAQTGRTAPRGRGKGFATGGYVGSGGPTGTSSGIVHLSVEDRQLLIDIRDRVGLEVVDTALASATNGVNANNSARRAG